MSYRTYSYFMSCPDHGIIGFTLGQHTLFDAHKLIFAPKTCIFLEKQALTRRILCEAGPLLGLKIASVRPPGAHETLAGLVFQAHNGLKCHPMRSRVLSDTFIPHVMPKPWNHWFSPNKTHKTLIFPSKTEVRSRSVWPVGPLLGLKIASVRPPRCSRDSSGASISGT